MTTHARFDGSIPELYDACLGPLLFEFSAADLARRLADVRPAGRLLEVACGTGISTGFLRGALPDSIEIVATDINPGMLEVARARRGGLAGVTFAEADALALPYEDESFAAVACQFGIMFFPDKARGLAEMARVLEPDGRLAFNVWDSLERNTVVALAGETIGAFFDADPPTFLEVPFGFYAIDPVKALLEAAGFDDIAVHVVSETVEAADPHRIARGFVEGNPGVHEVRERANADVAAVVEAMAAALEMEFGPAPLRIPLQEIVYTARNKGV